MPILVVRAEGATGARFATQLIDHGHQVIGIRRSPRNAGRVPGLSAEATALGRSACIRPGVAGSS